MLILCIFSEAEYPKRCSLIEALLYKGYIVSIGLVTKKEFNDLSVFEKKFNPEIDKGVIVLRSDETYSFSIDSLIINLDHYNDNEKIIAEIQRIKETMISV